MSHLSHPQAAWSTASLGDSAHTSPMELDALGQHMQQCSRPRSRLFSLQCGADFLHQGLLSRFVTSLTLLAALVATVVLVW